MTGAKGRVLAERFGGSRLRLKATPTPIYRDKGD